MKGRCRTSQVVDFIHFNGQRIDDVVMQIFELGVMKEILDISAASGVKIVDTYYVSAFGDQAFAKLRTYKAGTTTY